MNVSFNPVRSNKFSGYLSLHDKNSEKVIVSQVNLVLGKQNINNGQGLKLGVNEYDGQYFHYLSSNVLTPYSDADKDPIREAFNPFLSSDYKGSYGSAFKTIRLSNRKLSELRALFQTFLEKDIRFNDFLPRPLLESEQIYLSKSKKNKHIILENGKSIPAWKLEYMVENSPTLGTAFRKQLSDFIKRLT